MSSSQLKPIAGHMSHIAKLVSDQTPFTHALKAMKSSVSSGAKAGMSLFSIAILGGVIAGIILCNKHGLKHLTATHSGQIKKQLEQRFAHGVGTGILAVSAAGPLAFLIIGLIILFELGRDLPMAMKDGSTTGNFNQHLVKRRYFMGVAAGGLFGLVGNKVVMALLKK